MPERITDLARLKKQFETHVVKLYVDIRASRFTSISTVIKIHFLKSRCITADGSPPRPAIIAHLLHTLNSRTDIVVVCFIGKRFLKDVDTLFNYYQLQTNGDCRISLPYPCFEKLCFSVFFSLFIQFIIFVIQSKM